MELDIVSYATAVGFLSIIGFISGLCYIESNGLDKESGLWMIVMSIIFALCWLPSSPRTVASINEDCKYEIKVHTMDDKVEIMEAKEYCLQFAKKQFDIENKE